MSYDRPPVSDKYIVGQKIGQGGFGAVYFCQLKVTETDTSHAANVEENVSSIPPPSASTSAVKSEPEQYAMKVVVGFNRTERSLKHSWREVSTLCAAQSLRQVIPILDLMVRRPSIGSSSFNCLAPTHGLMDLHIVMPYLPYDLRTLLRQRRVTTEHQIRTIIVQLLLGIRGLHQATIIHRDLSSRNVLLDEQLSVFICDFGLARLYEPEEDMSERVITQWYRAPEVLLDCNYGPPVDVWAIGVMMAELFLGDHLFRGRDGEEDDQIDKIISVIGTVAEEDLPNPWDQELDDAKPGEPSVVPTSSPSRPRAKTGWFHSASDTAKALIHSQAGRTGSGIENLSFVIKPSRDAVDLMKQILQMNPDKRPTAVEALNHTWFQSDPQICNYILEESKQEILPGDFPQAEFPDLKNLSEEERLLFLAKTFKDYPAVGGSDRQVNSGSHA